MIRRSWGFVVVLRTRRILAGEGALIDHLADSGLDQFLPRWRAGWPKNVLHWKGIHRSILDICATAPMHFVIADGVVAMEGNGPLHGTHRNLGKLILADDPVAADFTCARLMGLDPNRVWHLDRASHLLGNGSNHRIDLIAEALPPRAIPFKVLPEF